MGETMPGKIEMTLKHASTGREVLLATWTDGGFVVATVLTEDLAEFLDDTEPGSIDEDDPDPTIAYLLCARPALT